MKRLMLISALLLTACGGGSDNAPGGIGGEPNEIIISQNNLNRSVSCSNNEVVSVTGSNNNLTINSNCKKVTVTGNDNAISHFATTSVSNKGAGNTLITIQ